MENKFTTEDDRGALTGATDKVGPWTIKAIALEARDAAVIAARKDGVSVGQWLERRVREWTEQDRFTMVANLSAQPGPVLEEVKQAAQIMEMLARAGVPPPRSVTRLMWARVRERLGDATLGTGGRTQLVQIAVPGTPAGHEADQQHGEGEQ